MDVWIPDSDFYYTSDGEQPMAERKISGECFIREVCVSDVDRDLRNTDPNDEEKVNTLLDMRSAASKTETQWQRLGRVEGILGMESHEDW